MINPAWTWKPLGEVFEIGAGKTMSASARSGSAQYPFLRTSNVFWDEIDLQTVDTMSLTDSELKHKTLLPGDLLVCEGGDVGRSAVWNGEISVVSFQNHLHRLRPLVEDIIPRFYTFFFQSAFTQLSIYEGAENKTTIPNLSRNRLANLEVPVPKKQEQQHIVQVLSIIREAMRVNESIITKASELKHGTMHKLFTCGLRGEPQKKTEIGLVPESWEVVQFSSIRQWLQYGTSARCTERQLRCPVLRIPNIDVGKVLTHPLKYCDLDEAVASRYVLESGDLLFIRTNGVVERLGSCAVYEGFPQNALFASYLIRARLKGGVNPRFIAFYFGSETGSNLVKDRATPAADGKYNLNTGSIDSLPIPVPPSEQEQQEIVGILDVIDQKIDLHRRKKAVLEELFKSLLHKLMTGEVRVDDLDLSALEDTPPQAQGGSA